MSVDYKYICAKDKHLKLEPHPLLNEDRLMITTPLGQGRWVNALRFLLLGNSKLGVIIDYRDETHTLCSYISFWDGRDGVYLPGQVTDDAYYVPWMDCFSVRVKGRDKSEYICIAAEKRNAWITEAFRLINTSDASGGSVQYNRGYGFFVRPDNSDDELPIDEIKIASGAVEVVCGSRSFHVGIASSERDMHRFPNSARRKYNQKEVLES